MNEETRKLAITIAAAIFAARALTDWDGKRSPRLVASVYVGFVDSRWLRRSAFLQSRRRSSLSLI